MITNRVCIIGTGMSGTRRIKALSLLKKHRVNVSCFDADLPLSKKIAAENNISSYNSFDEILQEKEQLLCIVSTPPATHFPIAKQLLEKNHHLLVEKPVFLQLNEINEATEIAGRKNLILSTVAQHRFENEFPAFRKALEKK